MKLLRSALRAPACCVLTVAFVLAACGDDDVDIREGPSSAMLADSAVLAQMRDTVTVGRIIYDPPPDLSLASARQRRPEIFRPPTPAAPAAPQARDTTQRARRP
jgi:hypothetical protein